MARHDVGKVAKALRGVPVCPDVDVDPASSGGVALGSVVTKLPAKLLQGFDVIVGQDRGDQFAFLVIRSRNGNILLELPLAPVCVPGRPGAVSVAAGGILVASGAEKLGGSLGCLLAGDVIHLNLDPDGLLFHLCNLPCGFLIHGESSVFIWCVFPFGVHIFALKEDNSKAISDNILHKDDCWILCNLQPFSTIRNWRERAVFSFIEYSESQPESRPQPINKILLSGHARNGGLQANHLIKDFGRLMIQHGSEFFFFIGQTGSGFSILRITIKLLFIRINVPIEEVLQNVIRHGGHPPFSQCPPHRPRSGRCRCPSA